MSEAAPGQVIAVPSRDDTTPAIDDVTGALEMGLDRRRMCERMA